MEDPVRSERDIKVSLNRPLGVATEYDCKDLQESYFADIESYQQCQHDNDCFHIMCHAGRQ